MYYKTTLERTPKHIMFVPYESAPKSVKEYFDSCLTDMVNCVTDIFIAYDITEEKPMPLGFCVIDNLNITHSRYIKSLFQNTANFNNKDVDKDMFECIQNKRCLHISHWMFDEVLRDIRILKSIFLHLMRYARNNGGYDFVWCDGKNEIIYYPINDIDFYFNCPSSTSYFAQNFCNE